MCKQFGHYGRVLTEDGVVEGSVATAVHHIRIGTMLQQYSGTFFFLALYGLLLLHQETDSLGVQNKHILGFTYCRIQMKLISFCPKHLNQTRLRVTCWLLGTLMSAVLLSPSWASISHFLSTKRVTTSGWP